MVLLAVGTLIISLLVNTVYVYQHASGEGNLLTFLLEKYASGIERFFSFLLFPLFLYKVVSIVSETDSVAGNMILLVVIFGAGLQFIALSWRSMEKDLFKRSGLTLTATMVSCLCLMLVFLGPILPFELRIFLIAVFSIVSGWLAYYMEEEPKKLASSIMAVLVPVLFLGWALIRLGIIPSSVHWIFFNLPVLLLLFAGLLICRKYGTMRTYMMVSLSAYLFEYLK